MTESVLEYDQQVAQALLACLRNVGFRLALDDFGTGYSSFVRLMEFDFSYVKIDRSLVSAMHKDSRAFSVIKAISRMAEAIDVLVIAEGVESKDQLDLLRQLKCNSAQGFFISRPLSLDNFLQFSAVTENS